MSSCKDLTANSTIEIRKSLKGQSHEIFDLGFFHQSSFPRSLIIVLKYFRIWFRFRRDIANLCRLRAMRHSAEL
jgi:hypothetical protein